MHWEISQYYLLDQSRYLAITIFTNLATAMKVIPYIESHNKTKGRQVVFSLANQKQQQKALSDTKKAFTYVVWYI